MTTKLRIAVLLVGLLLLVEVPSHAQDRDVALDIRQLMTTSEFREAGLPKLSEDELDRVNQWLARFTVTVVQGVRDTLGVSEISREVIESTIDGDFEEWQGETIFKLMNGQIWQQASYANTYHYSVMPDVVIYRTSGGGYKMKVEGVDGTIYVRRLR